MSTAVFLILTDKSEFKIPLKIRRNKYAKVVLKTISLCSGHKWPVMSGEQSPMLFTDTAN